MSFESREAKPYEVVTFFPSSWRAAVDFATHEHDGTYGASFGTRSLLECQVCGAWVSDTDKHIAWHAGKWR